MTYVHSTQLHTLNHKAILGQAWVSISFVGVIVPDEKVIKEEKLISKMLWG